MATPRVDRWRYLITGAFRLDDTPLDEAPAEARGYLLSVLDVFPKELDPVDDLEAYAVRRMARSLLRALDSTGRGPRAQTEAAGGRSPASSGTTG